MDPDEQNPQNISWWIASLAMSILLCAVFAGYLFDIKEDLNNSKIRDEILGQRMDVLASEVDTLRRHMMVQQIQLVAPEKAPAAANAPPPAEAPAVQPLPGAAPAEIKPAPAPMPLPPQPPKH